MNWATVKESIWQFELNIESGTGKRYVVHACRLRLGPD